MAKTKLDKSADVVYLAKKPAELEAFIEWLAIPKSERRPDSQKALADELGVTPQQIGRWKRDPRVISRVQQLRRHRSVSDSYADVVSALESTACDSSHPRQVAAAKLYFEEVARMVDEPIAMEVENLPDDKLRELMVEAIDELDERTG